MNGKVQFKQHIIDYHNQSHEFMVLTLADGKKVSMPRYYKDKIYEEYIRIMFGKLQLEAMQEKTAKLLKEHNLSASELDERKRLQTDAMYQNQIIKSAARQKTF